MNRSFNVQMLRVSMLIVLMLLSGIMTAHVDAQNEPPSGTERIIGPPIDGVLTAALDESMFAATIVIVGNCNGINGTKIPVALGPVPYPISPAGFANATASDMDNFRIRGGGAPGCYSLTGGEDLIITGVTKFNNTGTAIGAEVSISVVEPK